MKKAVLFKKLDNQKVKCLACSHYCIIAPNQKGICGVRENIKGNLYLLVYGKAAAINIDPIEKKPLYHFMPGTEVLSFGTVGCNFHCDFCQNFDISQIAKPPQNKILGRDIFPQKIVEIAKEKNIPSIAYTYNEPTIFFEYAYDTAKLAKKEGIKNIYVSNGYESKEAREKISPLLDAINVDLKSFDDNFYTKYCGAKLKPVLSTIKYFYNKKVHLEITTLIIPGVNDSETNIKNIANFISKIDIKIPWHISRFYPCYKMTHLPPTPLESLEKTKKIGHQSGLKNIYIGNV